MKTDQIVMCVVALLLGMLLANMLKNVCGCKVVEGHESDDLSTVVSEILAAVAKLQDHIDLDQQTVPPPTTSTVAAAAAAAADVDDVAAQERAANAARIAADVADRLAAAAPFGGR